MQVLSFNQTHQISGGNVYDDLKSLKDNGITHREMTLGALTWGAGIVIGSFLPMVLVPFASLGAIGGLLIYDWQANSHTQV